MSTTQQFHLPLDLWGQKTEMSRLETILLLSHIANLNLKLGTGISSHLSNCQPWLRGKSWIRSLAGDLSYCLKHQIAATSQHFQIYLASQVKACTRAYIYLVSEKFPQTSNIKMLFAASSATWFWFPRGQKGTQSSLVCDKYFTFTFKLENVFHCT